jgi:hypothetical protein
MSVHEPNPKRTSTPHILQIPATLLMPLLAVALVLLTGCGSSSNGVANKPAAQILAAARTAARTATAVRIVTNTKLLTGQPSKLDASLSKQQAHAQITFFGIGFQTIRAANTIYIKGNKSFNARMEVAQHVKVPPGQWLKGTTATLGQIASLTNIEKELPVILSGSGKITKGKTTKINGQPAIALKLTRKLYTGTLYVATTGQPYPLKLTKTGQETGQTTFTNWNDPVTVTPPAHAIDMSQLKPLKKGH